MKFKNIKTFKLNPNPQFFSTSQIKIKEWSGVAIDDRAILLSIIFWLIGIISSLLLIVYFLNKIPLEIPLFYSRVWGNQQLAPRNFLFLLPVGLLAVGIFNIGLAISTYPKNQVLSYLLSAATLLTTLFTTLCTINILRLMS